MTTELARRPSGTIDLDEVNRISRSKLVPEHFAKDPASVEYMMLIGEALGIPPISAFQHIFVFEDKKTKRLKAGMSAHLMHALAIAAGHTVHVEGDAIKATAVLVRNTSSEDLDRFQRMREEERRQKLGLMEDTERLYQMQRQQIRDQIEDLKALVDMGGGDDISQQIQNLAEQLSSLRTKYDLDGIREQVTTTKFDLTKLTRFESVWTFGRASAAGLTSKDVWNNFRPEMLKARAKTTVIRDGAIEVILGIRNIFNDLGLTFDEDASTDDKLATANVLYTAEELGADVDEHGAPLQGRVVNVTGEGVSRGQDQLIRAARGLVEGHTAQEICDWVNLTAGKPDMSSENKISRLAAVLTEVGEVGRAGEEVLSGGEESRTLSAHLETTIDTLR